MPDQQPPLDLTINPNQARSFSINVPFYLNSVDVARVIGEMQEQIRTLQEQVSRLRATIENP